MMSKQSRRRFLGGLGVTSILPAWMKAAGSFSQLPSEPSVLRFAVVSDGHFGQPDTDYLTYHKEMILWLERERRGRGLDFVVFNGDLIHNDGTLLAPLRGQLEELRTPYFVTKGNHDQVSDARWKEVWGYEVNHDFVEKGCAVLLGTTSNQAGEYLCANEEWLKSRLQEHRERKWIFVFLHICQNKVTRHGIDCPRISSLLEETKNVAAVFHGHDHDIDNVIYSRNRAYFFDGHMGGNWGTNYRGYRILEMSSDGALATYQCNPAAFYVNGTSIG